MARSSKGVNRGRFLRTTGLGIAMAALADGEASAPAWAAGGPAPTPEASTPHQALDLLKAGNARFVGGHPHCGPQTARRVELTQGQSPFAIVLGCSDSRVPIETVFDQVPGNIFAVRLAGNFVDDNGLGSIEYAIAVLKSSLIVVLGHQACGAVDATVKYVRDGTTQPGHIQGIIEAIAPAAKAVKGHPGDWLANAIAQNVKNNVAAIPARSSIAGEAVKSGRVQVIGGIYDLHSGKVGFL
jgi:carbonic anhydrase